MYLMKKKFQVGDLVEVNIPAHLRSLYKAWFHGTQGVIIEYDSIPGMYYFVSADGNHWMAPYELLVKVETNDK